MRILKYLLLLFLLSLFALTIFIATQKGDFTIEKSKIIYLPKKIVFNYVNDANNWEKWNSWAVEDPKIKISLSPKTIGKGSICSWTGKDGNGDIQTLFVKENDSIAQKMNYNGNTSDVFISFKDTMGGTKVTWKTIGEMGFAYKILTIFNGGAKSAFGMMFQKSLVNLDKKLNDEINAYSVKINGIFTMPESFYIGETFTCEISKVAKNSEIIFPKIISFCNKKNLSLAGKPFIIYHTYDTINKLTKLSICIPIKDSVYATNRSDITFGKMQANEVLKTTLKGDHLHKKKALDEVKKYLVTQSLIQDTAFSHLEIYTSGIAKTIVPSKWITEIYIPVRRKVVYIKPLSTEPKVEIAPNTKNEKEIPSEF